MGKDNLSALAAGAAFQALLSLFPTLTAVVSLYGLVADPNMVARQITAMQGLLPPEAVKLIATWLQALVEGPTKRFGIGLIVGVLLVPSIPSLRSTSLRIAARPRDTRERTVPIGTSTILAASSYEAPSRPIRRISRRCSSRIRARARLRSRNDNPCRIGCRCGE
jgi:hypothetical protein